MEFELSHNALKFKKTMSDLDNMVLDFVVILSESKIRYVIVSGYVFLYCWAATRT